MPSFVPYFILAVLSAAVLIWIFIRSKRFHTFVAYLTFMGMIYIFEVFIVVVFAAYEYKPQITPIRYMDNMIGASVSNTLAVPTIATLIAVFQLRFRWIALFALLFGGIESLFLHLGVYVHVWWRVPYTVATLIFYFSLTKWWMRKLLGGSRPIRLVSFFMYTLALVYTTIFVLMLSGVRMFLPGIFNDIHRDDTFFTNIYGLMKALLLTAAIFWLRNWRWLFAVAAIIMISHYILIRSDILIVYIPMWLYISIYSVCCCVVIWLCFLARRSVEP